MRHQALKSATTAGMLVVEVYRGGRVRSGYGMSARFRSVSRARLRAERLREAWTALAAVIREEQAKSGFCGPDARSIEDIGDRALAEIDDLLFAWTARIAAQPRAQTANLRLREVLLRR
jgi:hypothetical protein